MKKYHSKLVFPEKRKSFPRGVVCILCGTVVPYGSMLGHKNRVHDELFSVPNTMPSGVRQLWVKIVQGGSPGLRKRRV